jgi:hypothetical protein
MLEDDLSDFHSRSFVKTKLLPPKPVSEAFSLSEHGGSVCALKA